jgi:hypothetical protein
MIPDMTDHDQNFKNLILDYPHQALAFLAEKEVADIDANLSPVEQDEYRQRYPKENQDMMTFSQRFTQQGRQEGRSLG